MDIAFKIQKETWPDDPDYDDLYDATEDEVIPYIDKTFQFIQDMEKLIVFKGE